MTNTVTYRSENAIPGQEWLAYVVMPNGKLWMVVSFASTEEEAKRKIISLWESERARYFSEGQPERDVNPWTDANRRGHHLKGLVWVIDRDTREKSRVSAEQADAYVKLGTHERGGPRSK